MPIRFVSRVAIAFFTICALITAGVQAQPVPNFKLNVQWGANNWNSDSTNMHLTPDPSNPNGWSFEGGHNRTDWSATWSGALDVDPALNAALAFTNNTAATQSFTATFTLPTVGAITAPSTMAGGVTVSVSGAQAEVETLSTPAGDFMYRASTGSGGFVGAPADLLPPPFALNSGPLGVPASAGPFNYGPVNGPGLNAVDSISIRYAFTLTPGASATLNGTFVIVPEPATLALLPLAAMGVARRRRV